MTAIYLISPHARNTRATASTPTCEDCGVRLVRGSSKKGAIRIERRNLGGKRRVHDEEACREIREGRRKG